MIEKKQLTISQVSPVLIKYIDTKRGPNGDVGVKETLVQMAKANGMRQYGHVLRRDDRHARLTKEDVQDASGERRARVLV